MPSQAPPSADLEFRGGSEPVAGEIGRAKLHHIHGRKILIVEDEFLIAEDLAAILKDAGAEVIGPADSLPRAIRLFQETEKLDAATLNVDLHGVPVFPLVDELQAAAVPILFLTGYDDAAIPDRYSAIRRCEKPVGAARLVEELTALLRPVAA